MEFIGDKASVWKKLGSEVFKGVTEVQDHVAHVFSSWQMGEPGHEVRGGFTLDELQDFLALVVGNECCKLSSSVMFSAPEGVLVDADSAWPGVLVSCLALVYRITKQYAQGKRCFKVNDLVTAMWAKLRDEKVAMLTQLVLELEAA